jgi:hypothetical protein
MGWSGGRLSVDGRRIGLNGRITCGQTRKFPVGAARAKRSADIGADFSSARDADSGEPRENGFALEDPVAEDERQAD